MNRELDQGELRDRLPDIIHGTLPEGERVAAEAAVAADASLAHELAFLREARVALSQAGYRPNVDKIAAAIPRPDRVRTVRVARWRIAAAVATLAVGGASLALLQGGYSDGLVRPVTVVGETTTVAMTDAPSLSMGFDLSELAEDEFAQLLADLAQSGGLVQEEPRVAVVVPIATGGAQ
jgi:hypothetical protein